MLVQKRYDVFVVCAAQASWKTKTQSEADKSTHGSAAFHTWVRRRNTVVLSERKAPSFPRTTSKTKTYTLDQTVISLALSRSALSPLANAIPVVL
jgi:hypothetical protein